MTDHPFTQVFAKAWAAPSLDSLMAPLREDVLLVQPLSGPLHGKAAARAAFSQILYRFPGLRGETHQGSVGDNGALFIDWTMIAPVGRRELAIPVIDRFEFIDGAVKRRDAYFDPMPIITAVASSPVSLIRHTASIFRRGQ